MPAPAQRTAPAWGSRAAQSCPWLVHWLLDPALATSAQLLTIHKLLDLPPWLTRPCCCPIHRLVCLQELDRIRLKREAKANNGFYVEPEAKLVFVVRGRVWCLVC